MKKENYISIFFLHSTFFLLSRMAIDDSFRKPGSVPFKWEIRPGVPKIQQQQQKQPSPERHSPPLPQQKLRPPPAGFQFLPPLEPRSQSFRSSPRIRSERWRLEKPTLRPECVTPGCFPAPLLRRKDSSKRRVRATESKPGYSSDLETLARWSVSSRKSFSTFTASPASSSFSSYKSSPRPMGDEEWAGFGLF